MTTFATQQTAETFTVRTYRINNGAHVAHLDRTFATAAEAQAHALAANCKAYAPFISIAQEA